MLEITDNTVIITKDDGTEDTWKIYFYYHNPDRNKDFFFLFKEIAQVERLIAMMNTTLLLSLLPMIRSAPPVPLRTIPSSPTKMERVSLWVL